MIYFIVKDGRVPSDAFIEEMAATMGNKVNFQFRHGPSLNKAASLLEEIKEKPLSDWEVILIIPMNSQDRKVETYTINSPEQKKEILQELEKEKASTELTGVILERLLIQRKGE